MEARLGRRKFRLFAFDLESHNDEESIRKKETSMWLGCLIDETSRPYDESSYLYDIGSFVDRLEELSNPKRRHGEKKKPCRNIAIYIYNLSFEWSFILPELKRRGFRFCENIQEEDQYCFNSVSTHSVSSVWNVNLKFGAKSGRIVIRDLAKLYGGGLANVAKSFGIPTQKGEMDYRLNRLHGHKVTEEEKIYCFKDTRIIVEILLEMIARKDKDFFSAMSMASYSMKMMIKEGWRHATKPYHKFREQYPCLGKEETEFQRNGVSGGITYAPERWQFKDIKKEIVCIDKNSMHPSSAYFNRFPYGEGEHLDGEPTNYADYSNLCHIKVSYYGVKLHSIIKLIGLYYVDDFELTVWDFEIRTMRKCYQNLRIEYIDYYRYKKKPLPWARYYAKRRYKLMAAKAKGDKFNTMYNKLLLNSSYGKLLENSHLTVFENTIGDDGIITSVNRDKEKPSYLSDEEWSMKELNSKYTYIPVGSAIPAYSRCDLIETALRISPDGSKIVYFDTDSIFFIKDEETMRNFHKYVKLGDFLGEWKIDKEITRMQATAPKRYKYQDKNGDTKIKAGGINFTEYVTQKAKEKGITGIEEVKEFIDRYSFSFDEINIVNSDWKVQRAFRVKGGTIIEFQDKQMKVPEKYREIFEKNANGANI